jgi:hypothetical protein
MQLRTKNRHSVPIWPFKSYTITTRLPPDDCYQRLKSATATDKRDRVFSSFGFLSVFRGQGDKLFRGRLEPDAFKIVRIMHYSNSFRPIITGHLAAAPDGTRVDIVMRMEVLVSIFMGFWLGVIILVIPISVLTAIGGQDATALLMLPVAGLMIMLGYGLMSRSFDYEAKKAIEALAGILESADTKILENTKTIRDFPE